MRRIVILVTLLFGVCLPKRMSSRRKERNPQAMHYKLLNTYNRGEPPSIDGPTEVQIGIYINGFFRIDSRNMDYTMSFYLRMAWRDRRLMFQSDSYSEYRAPHGAWNEIWTPDLFMRNEKNAQAISIISPQRLLRINATGHVWYVVKYAAILSCPMHLQKFPFDNQTCPMMFESFGYTMDTLFLSWLDKPVDVDKDLQLPQFTLKDVILYDCSQNYTTGAYPCLDISFVLHRDIGYYILVVFIPSLILVIISWLQFWLSVEAVTGRVIVGLFPTFAIVGQMSSLRSTLPNVSYLTSLDIWMMVCCLFIFATLIQLAVVEGFVQRKKQVKDCEDKRGSLLDRIDFISRIVYPAVFLAFNFLFWIIVNV